MIPLRRGLLYFFCSRIAFAIWEFFDGDSVLKMISCGVHLGRESLFYGVSVGGLDHRSLGRHLIG